MKILMSRFEFLTAYNRAKAFTASSGQRDSLRLIHCKLHPAREKLIFVALDGQKLYDGAVPCVCFEDDEHDRFTLPDDLRIQNKGGDIAITVELGHIVISDGVFSQTIQRDSSLFLTQRLDDFAPKDQPMFTMRFNTRHLADAVKAFGKDAPIRIDFFAENEGIVITGEQQGDHALVLPLYKSH